MLGELKPKGPKGQVAGELSRSLPLSHHRSVGYRGRQCGFNEKHQSTKAPEKDLKDLNPLNVHERA